MVSLEGQQRLPRMLVDILLKTGRCIVVPGASPTLLAVVEHMLKSLIIATK